MDAEHIARDIEKRLNDKLTERLLERFEVEFEGLMRKVEKTREDFAANSTEQKLETSNREVETVGSDVEVFMRNGNGQEGDSETVRIESDEDSSEACMQKLGLIWKLNT